MRVAAIVLLAGLSFGQDRDRLRPVPANSQGFRTGPEIGAQIPAFRLQDQSGKMRDFRSLRGKNGLLLVFVRSADW